MNSWTDIGLIIAIVIGLISAASLPMVSVNAVSPESLRLHQASRTETAPWALVSKGRLESWTASPAEAAASVTVDAATAGIQPLDSRQAGAASP